MGKESRRCIVVQIIPIDVRQIRHDLLKHILEVFEIELCESSVHVCSL